MQPETPNREEQSLSSFTTTVSLIVGALVGYACGVNQWWSVFGGLLVGLILYLAYSNHKAFKDPS